MLVNVNNGVPCPSCAPPQCLGVDTSSAPFNLRLQDCVLGGALSSNMQAWSLDPDGFLRTAADTLQCADASTHSPFSGVELLACSSEALRWEAVPLAANVLQVSSNAGGYGGTCRCPDGATYQVGDNNDNCETLACVGGEQIGQCQLANGPWSHQRALCAPPPEDALVARACALLKPVRTAVHDEVSCITLLVLLSVAAASAICLVLAVCCCRKRLCKCLRCICPWLRGDTSQSLLDENDVQMQNLAVESTVSTKSDEDGSRVVHKVSDLEAAQRPGRRSSAHRSVKMTLVPPRNWCDEVTDGSVRLDAEVDAAEWHRVSDACRIQQSASAGGGLYPRVEAGENPPLVKIQRIERVQHLLYWNNYKANLQSMTMRERTRKEQGKDFIDDCERHWLYHGTTKETAEAIIAHGFNRSYAGKNATVYGPGTYFARDLSYSWRSQYSRPGPHGEKYIFLCRVAVGAFCKWPSGSTSKEPPTRDTDTRLLFDSTTDADANPSIIVSYKDFQVYPEYLVVFSGTS